MPWITSEFVNTMKTLIDKGKKGSNGDIVSVNNIVKIGNSDFSKPLELIVLDKDTFFIQFSEIDKEGSWYKEVLRKFEVHTKVKTPSNKELKNTMKELDVTSSEAIEAIKAFKKAKKAKA